MRTIGFMLTKMVAMRFIAILLGMTLFVLMLIRWAIWTASWPTTTMTIPR